MKMLLSALLLTAFTGLANDVEVYNKSKEFLLKHSDEKADLKWSQALTDRIASQSLPDNAYVNQSVQDTFMGKKLNSLDFQDCILICRYVVYYREHGLEVPSKWVEAANKEDIETKFFEHASGEALKQLVGGKP